MASRFGLGEALVIISGPARLKRDLPNARLEVIDRCGHYPALERPSGFARLTLEFLAETPTRSR
jgi:pimeloyl-ACP methyl ester carboxylesterase